MLSWVQKQLKDRHKKPKTKNKPQGNRTMVTTSGQSKSTVKASTASIGIDCSTGKRKLSQETTTSLCVAVDQTPSQTGNEPEAQHWTVKRKLSEETTSLCVVEDETKIPTDKEPETKRQRRVLSTESLNESIGPTRPIGGQKENHGRREESLALDKMESHEIEKQLYTEIKNEHIKDAERRLHYEKGLEDILAMNKAIEMKAQEDYERNITNLKMELNEIEGSPEQYQRKKEEIQDVQRMESKRTRKAEKRMEAAIDHLKSLNQKAIGKYCSNLHQFRCQLLKLKSEDNRIGDVEQNKTAAASEPKKDVVLKADLYQDIKERISQEFRRHTEQLELLQTKINSRKHNVGREDSAAKAEHARLLGNAQLESPKVRDRLVEALQQKEHVRKIEVKQSKYKAAGADKREKLELQNKHRDSLKELRFEAGRVYADQLDGLKQSSIARTNALEGRIEEAKNYHGQKANIHKTDNHQSEVDEKQLKAMETSRIKQENQLRKQMNAYNNSEKSKVVSEYRELVKSFSGPPTVKLPEKETSGLWKQLADAGVPEPIVQTKLLHAESVEEYEKKRLKKQLDNQKVCGEYLLEIESIEEKYKITPDVSVDFIEKRAQLLLEARTREADRQAEKKLRKRHELTARRRMRTALNKEHTTTLLQRQAKYASETIEGGESNDDSDFDNELTIDESAQASPRLTERRFQNNSQGIPLVEMELDVSPQNTVSEYEGGIDDTSASAKEEMEEDRHSNVEPGEEGIIESTDDGRHNITDHIISTGHQDQINSTVQNAIIEERTRHAEWIKAETDRITKIKSENKTWNEKEMQTYYKITGDIKKKLQNGEIPLELRQSAEQELLDLEKAEAIRRKQTKDLATALTVESRRRKRRESNDHTKKVKELEIIHQQRLHQQMSPKPDNRIQGDIPYKHSENKGSQKGSNCQSKPDQGSLGQTIDKPRKDLGHVNKNGRIQSKSIIDIRSKLKPESDLSSKQVDKLVKDIVNTNHRAGGITKQRRNDTKSKNQSQNVAQQQAKKTAWKKKMIEQESGRQNALKEPAAMKHKDGGMWKSKTSIQVSEKRQQEQRKAYHKNQEEQCKLFVFHSEEKRSSGIQKHAERSQEAARTSQAESRTYYEPQEKREEAKGYKNPGEEEHKRKWKQVTGEYEKRHGL